MNIDLAALPDDVATLHRMIGDLATTLDSERAEARAEIERLRRIVKMLQRCRFGRRSERLDPDQLQLGLEDLDADIARAEADLPPEASGKRRKPRRAPGDRPSLPDHLPREDVTLDIGAGACPCCGGAVHEIGETVSEMLDYVPARLRVLRIRRPKYGCRACGTIHQAPAPERPIAKGLASPSLLAHVLVSKYCDHLPLYRQSQIFARQGVDLNLSTLANWVGGACWWLEALHAWLADHVFASDKLFAPSTPPAASLRTGLIRRSRSSIPVADERGRAGSGSMRATIGHGADRTRRQRSTSTAPTARRSGRRLTWTGSAVSCRSTVTPGSRGSPKAGKSSWRHAGRTPDASSTSSTRPPARRSPPRPCAGSPSSTRSKRRFAVAARRSARAIATPGRGLWSTP